MSMNEIRTAINPFVKWVGGKRQLMEQLKSSMPGQFGRYFEPFIGGGALLLDIQPADAVINDVNVQLLNVYRQLMLNADAVVRAYEEIDSQPVDNARYLAVRELYNGKILADEQDTECAAMFIWLNKHCFNGLYRVNRKGLFNASWNKETGRIPLDADNLRRLGSYLKTGRVSIRNCDFEKACEDAKPGDFVYLDPPYVPESSSADFTSYAKTGFGLEDHRRVADLVRKLTARGVYVMVSNNDVPLVRELYAEFDINAVDARRMINRDAAKRTGREVIVTNYKLVDEILAAKKEAESVSRNLEGNTMKKNSRSTAKELDQFYTRSDVAEHCCRILEEKFGRDFFSGKKFLEPSAGTGAFVSACRRVFGDDADIRFYDIDPKFEGTVRADFLKKKIRNRHLVTIGNPPFGQKSSLAIDFFNHASENSDIIAFVVPVQFEKFSVQRHLSSRFRLIHSERLDSNSFIHAGSEYSVRCVFQIWTTLDIGEDLRIREAPPTKHPDFELFIYNNSKYSLKYFDKKKYGWSFAVPRQGYYDYSERIVREEDLNPRIQYMFFKADSAAVLKRLDSIDYAGLSLGNTTVPGFGKADIVREYSRILKTAASFGQGLIGTGMKQPGEAPSPAEGRIAA